MSTAKLGSALLVILALVLGAAPARAETADCTPITTLPFIITVQGVYCLTGNLSTATTPGTAIDIQTNNVVVDLNGFTLSGLGAGPGTTAVGIHALNRQNITLKNGTIRGFLRGIWLEDIGGSQGHLVEDIRADQNTFVGMQVEGAGTLVSTSQAVATGGTTTIANADAIGILTLGAGPRVVDNDVINTVKVGTGTAVGIQFQTGTAGGLAADNRITGADKGIEFVAGATGKCRGNLTFGVTTPFVGCTDASSGKLAQTISFTSTAPGAATVGGATYTVMATATSGLAVAFMIDATATSVCTIAGATVSFTAVGTCVINANQAGDATYDPAPQVQQSFAVGKGSQTISFTSVAPTNATVGGPTYMVTATATSGLAVAFTIDASASTVCSVAGATVSFIGTGTCVINANQAGNATYDPAPQVQQSFAVKTSQTISFTSVAPTNALVGGPAYMVTATATSGLAVTFTIDASASTVCSIAGATVSFIGGGTCVINANQAGDATFAAAPQVQQSFMVKNMQTISLTSLAPTAAVYQGPTYTVTATATSGLAVTFTIDASASTVCSIAGAVVSFIGTGACTINANQAGNATFAAAPQVQQSFGVGPKLDDDSYSVVGNTQLVVAGHSAPTTPFTTDATTVLANDTADVAISVTPATNAATTGGGVITIDANGKFTYTPPAGQASGTDTYVYTGTANGVSRTATITFNISNIVWYVDNASGGTHDGRSNTPFTNMGSGANGLGTALSNAGPAAGATIYVAKGSGATTGSYVFKANQHLVGAGATLSVGSLNVPGNAANTPTLNTALTLASGVTMTGLDMDGGSVNLTGSSVTTVSVNIGRFRRTGSAAAKAINLAGSGNTGTFDFKSIGITGVSGTGNTGVSISNLTGHFNVAGTDTGVTPNGGTISGYGANGMEFKTVANGGATAISLNKMTLNGNGVSQTVPGSDTNCGGAPTTGNNLQCVANLYLQAVNKITLDNMTISNSGQAGINGNDVTDFILTNSTVNNNGTALATGENGLNFQNLRGTSKVEDTNITDNASCQFCNTTLTGTLTLDVKRTNLATMTIGNAAHWPATGASGHAIESSAFTSATMTLRVDGVTLQNMVGQGVLSNVQGSSTLTGYVKNSTFSYDGAGVNIQTNNTANANTFDVMNNSFVGMSLQAVNYGMAAGSTGTLRGTISDNDIGTSGVAGSACDLVASPAQNNCAGITMSKFAAGALQVLVKSNTMYNVGQNGITVTSDLGGTVDVKIQSNTIHEPYNSISPVHATGNAIQVNLGTGNGTGQAACVDIGGAGVLKNDIDGAENPSIGGPFGWDPNNPGRGMYIRSRNSVVTKLPNYAGGNNTTNVRNFLAGQNTITNQSFTTAGVDNATGTFANGTGNCNTP